MIKRLTALAVQVNDPRLLAAMLPALVPLAAVWVRRQEEKATRTGQPLDLSELEAARAVGVRHPERIRLRLVPEIAGPLHFIFRKFYASRAFFGPGLRGITYRYGIVLRQDCYPDLHLVAHECVHVAQYEKLGGLSAFLRPYFRECLLDGYPGGPLEQEAIDRSSRL